MKQIPLVQIKRRLDRAWDLVVEAATILEENKSDLKREGGWVRHHTKRLRSELTGLGVFLQSAQSSAKEAREEQKKNRGAR